MITLTWGNLKNRDFCEAIDKVCNKPMGFELGQKFVLIGRELKKQDELMKETHLKLLKEFGKPDPDPKKRDQYTLNEATITQFEAEYKKLLAHSFDIRVSRIDATKLSEKIDLSPSEWLALDNLLSLNEVATELKPVPSIGGKDKTSPSLTQ